MKITLDSEKLYALINKHANNRDCTACPAYPNACNLEAIETVKDCEESLYLFLDISDKGGQDAKSETTN